MAKTVMVTFDKDVLIEEGVFCNRTRCLKNFHSICQDRMDDITPAYNTVHKDCVKAVLPGTMLK